MHIDHDLGPGQHSARGNGNNCRREDVVFGIRLDTGKVVELK